MLQIREETPGDYGVIREINRTAFLGEAEALLVDRLRENGMVVVSLVAIDRGDITGHILFSELFVETAEGTVPAAALAPMAVLPAWQRMGIGSAMVREGLEICRRRGKQVVVVLGHPNYYPRFGFSPELATQLHGPYSGAAWMALELVPGALTGVQAKVRYPPAFEVVSN